MVAKTIAAALAAAALMGSGSAQALTLTWDQLADPTPVLASGAAGLTEIAVTNGDRSDITDVYYYVASFSSNPLDLGGGFTDLAHNANTYSPFGEQLFTGDLANPVFAAGVFSLFSDTLGHSGDGTIAFVATNEPGVLFVTVVLPDNKTSTPSVPEPATWSLLLLGFAGLGGLAVRKRPITLVA
jgi:PEP-CTERM motif